MPSKRNIGDKAYEDDQDFHHFVDQDMQDKEYFSHYDCIDEAFRLLKKAKIIVSKSQFKVALVVMQKTLVPICEAAAICQVTREYFRTLEKRGKLTIIRETKEEGKRKVFIKPADILKYLTGKL